MINRPIAWALLCLTAGLFIFSGCSSYNSSSSSYTTTSTSSSSTTSTTLGTGPNTVSGTISWTGAASGFMVIVLATDSSIANIATTEGFAVGAGSTSAAYTNFHLPSGTYYVGAILCKGVSSKPAATSSGDLGGEYSDGKVPYNLYSYFSNANTASGTATGITVTGSGATGVNFALGSTCTSPFTFH